MIEKAIIIHNIHTCIISVRSWVFSVFFLFSFRTTENKGENKKPVSFVQSYPLCEYNVRKRAFTMTFEIDYLHSAVHNSNLLAFLTTYCL